MPGQEWSAMHAHEPTHALPMQKWFLPAVISHVIKTYDYKELSRYLS